MPNSEDHYFFRKCLSCSKGCKPIKESLPQVAVATKVPLLTIKRFQHKKILHSPLFCSDVAFLYRYHLVREVQKSDCESTRKGRRMLNHGPLKQDYQRWIYRHYIDWNSGERIFIKDVIWEVSARFVIPDGIDLYSEVFSIRVIAYNDRRKARKLKVAPGQIARERFAQLRLGLEGK